MVSSSTKLSCRVSYHTSSSSASPSPYGDGKENFAPHWLLKSCPCANLWATVQHFFLVAFAMFCVQCKVIGMFCVQWCWSEKVSRRPHQAILSLMIVVRAHCKPEVLGNMAVSTVRTCCCYTEWVHSQRKLFKCDDLSAKHSLPQLATLKLLWSV